MIEFSFVSCGNFGVGDKDCIFEIVTVGTYRPIEAACFNKISVKNCELVVHKRTLSSESTTQTYWDSSGPEIVNLGMPVARLSFVADDPNPYSSSVSCLYCSSDIRLRNAIDGYVQGLPCAIDGSDDSVGNAVTIGEIRALDGCRA